MDKQRVLERLDGLISMGEKVLATRYLLRGNVAGLDSVEDALFRQWRTSSVAFLNALPSEYVYRHEFENHCKHSYDYRHAEEGVAILRAAREDIEGGYLQKMETLVSASVFTDFLEMAEHLLDNGYKDPAASLAGAVLENGLRRICGSNNLTVKSDDNISSLNKRLADNSVYNRLQQREIEVWNKVRDYADHGHFNEYMADDVEKMLGGVNKFLSNYLV